MKVRGLIELSETSELVAEGDDAASSRAAVEALVPDGFDLLQVQHSMQSDGRVVATACIRLDATMKLEATGRDYTTARLELLSQVPAGWRLFHIAPVEGELR